MTSGLVPDDLDRVNAIAKTHQVYLHTGVGSSSCKAGGIDPRRYPSLVSEVESVQAVTGISGGPSQVSAKARFLQLRCSEGRVFGRLLRFLVCCIQCPIPSPVRAHDIKPVVEGAVEIVDINARVFRLVEGIDFLSILDDEPFSFG